MTQIDRMVLVGLNKEAQHAGRDGALSKFMIHPPSHNIAGAAR